MNIVQHTSPFYTKTRFLFKPSFIVCHWIVGSLTDADNVFTNPNTKPQRSAHYGVGDDNVHQYVEERYTAWHAGNWLANLQSIGIEHQGSPSMAISDATYASSAELIANIWIRWGMKPERKTLRPHWEFKKTGCPGSLDLDRLYNQALSTYHQILNPPPPAPTPEPTVEENHPTEKYIFTRDLAPGSSDRDEVTKMQHRLHDLGCLAIPEDQYGFYGPKTQGAILRLQTDSGILPSGSTLNTYGAGYFGPKTRAALNAR